RGHGRAAGSAGPLAIPAVLLEGAAPAAGQQPDVNAVLADVYTALTVARREDCKDHVQIRSIPATPAIPAIPAIPATPATPATPAVPVTPAIPARYRTPLLYRTSAHAAAGVSARGGDNRPAGAGAKACARGASRPGSSSTCGGLTPQSRR